MSESASRPASGPTEFGNLEANLRFIAEAKVVDPQTEILEIGSGSGTLLRHFLDKGYRIQGVDISRELIAEAKRWHGNLPLQQVEGVRLPFQDKTFDLVMGFDVFEHIADSDGHLAEVRRVLKPRGTYLIQTPNKWTNVVFETIRWRSFTRFREDHCSLHSLRELQSRLVRHHFRPHAFDIPAVNDFFRAKVRRYIGPAGVAALRVINPDRFPLALRTNLYVAATKLDAAEPVRG